MTFCAPAPQPEAPDTPLARRIEQEAAPRDSDGCFPRSAMEVLVAEGLTLPDAMLPDPAQGGMGRLLRTLAEVGQGDASVGRLLEGHANALEIVVRTAPETLRTRVLDGSLRGEVYGVWGADAPQNRLTVRHEGNCLRLSGEKLYCSGADGLSAALVLADRDGGDRCVLIVPVDSQLEIDRSRWQPMGMRASGSHRVVFDGVTLDPGMVVCDGATYLAEPWFSGGAMRFAAVQAGVARGLVEVATEHLVGIGRADAPHQAARLGTMAVALAGLDGVLDRAAAAWDAGCAPGAIRRAERAAAHGHLARVAAETALLDIADLVQRAVGLGGLLAPHPLERRLRDALTYARQPNPDGAREAAGRAFAAGLLDSRTA